MCWGASYRRTPPPICRLPHGYLKFSTIFCVRVTEWSERLERFSPCSSHVSVLDHQCSLYLWMSRIAPASTQQGFLIPVDVCSAEGRNNCKFTVDVVHYDGVFCLLSTSPIRFPSVRDAQAGLKSGTLTADTNRYVGIKRVITLCGWGYGFRNSANFAATRSSMSRPCVFCADVCSNKWMLLICTIHRRLVWMEHVTASASPTLSTTVVLRLRRGGELCDVGS